jgi:hypothetical protein
MVDFFNMVFKRATDSGGTRVTLVCIVASGLLVAPLDALAYIGPGLGTGAMVAVLGIVAGLLMLVVGVVWYPIKKLIRYIRSKR